MSRLYIDDREVGYGQQWSMRYDSEVRIVVDGAPMDSYINVINGCPRRISIRIMPGYPRDAARLILDAMSEATLTQCELHIDVGEHRDFLPVIWNMSNLTRLIITGEDGVWKGAPPSFMSTLREMHIPMTCLYEDAILRAFAAQKTVAMLIIDGIADPRQVSTLISGMAGLQSLYLKVKSPFDLVPILPLIPDTLIVLNVCMEGGAMNQAMRITFNRMITYIYTTRDHRYSTLLTDVLYDGSIINCNINHLVLAYQAACELVDTMDLDIIGQVMDMTAGALV